MAIRKSNKDHLKELASPLQLIPTEVLSEVDQELTFWTRHEREPIFVDLREFFHGASHPKATLHNWSGSFRGRPQLILELAPAIKEKIVEYVKEGVGNFISRMRSWWRLFDLSETPKNRSDAALALVECVQDLSYVHGVLAVEARFSCGKFNALKSVIDTTRAAMGLKPLHWQWAGSKRTDLPNIASERDFSIIWNGLKRKWFFAIDRWARADALISGAIPLDEGECNLLKNYLEYRNKSSGTKEQVNYASTKSIFDGRSGQKFFRSGFTFEKMYSGFFPISWDIRAGFHLCLQGTGWNVSTLLSLEVEVDPESGDFVMPYLKNHPSNPDRYVLEGHKNRGDSDHATVGDWKTSRSPGAICKLIFEKTKPIRNYVLNELVELKIKLKNSEAASSISISGKIRGEIIRLTIILKSAWIYLDDRGVVQALNNHSYAWVGRKSYLGNLVDEINSKLENGGGVQKIIASDFRDAYAIYVLQATGGSIFAVQKALKHRSIRTTMIYLNNKSMRRLAEEKWLEFGNVFWIEILENNTVDPTVLAQWMRFGRVTARERFRLKRYRQLSISRIGVLCKNPKNPPEIVAPNFVVGGERYCPSHRCTICPHGGVTKDSLDGLAMRKAELIYIESNSSITLFSKSSFADESNSLSVVFNMFPSEQVISRVEHWLGKIKDGTHRPMILNDI